MPTLNPILPALDDWQSMGDNPPLAHSVTLWVVLRWRAVDPTSLPTIVAGPYGDMEEAEAAGRAAMTTSKHLISLATLNLSSPA